MKVLKSVEILEVVLLSAKEKAEARFLRLCVLGILAGIYIALAAYGSTMGAFNLLASPEYYGLGRVVAGSLFTVGLMLVVTAGGELFTGNTMMVANLLTRDISVKSLLRNWTIVYLTNFVGALLIAYMVFESGLLDSAMGMLGGVTVKIAAGKTSLAFIQSIYLGIMCNILVCLGVWIATGADTMVGKLLGCFFPVWLFVSSGFEHSIANMYYIPAGLMAKTNPSFVELSGLSREVLNSLTLGGLAHNLLGVTIGNIIGGGIFVAVAYYLAYKNKD